MTKTSVPQVEDFTDISQNVARAVGPAEVKQIYKCIEISIRHLTSFMAGQIGLQLKDLLFGVDGIPSSIPGGIANFNMTAQFPESRGKRILTGKREKKSMIPFNKNSTVHMKRRQLVKGMQVQQAVLAETWRMRTDGKGTAAHGTLTNSGQWEVISAGGGWEQAATAAGYEARGWGVSEQNRWGGWESGNQQQQSSWGWGWQQSSSGWDNCVSGAMQQGGSWEMETTWVGAGVVKEVNREMLEVGVGVGVISETNTYDPVNSNLC